MWWRIQCFQLRMLFDSIENFVFLNLCILSLLANNYPKKKFVRNLRCTSLSLLKFSPTKTPICVIFSPKTCNLGFNGDLPPAREHGDGVKIRTVVKGFLTVGNFPPSAEPFYNFDDGKLPPSWTSVQGGGGFLPCTPNRMSNTVWLYSAFFISWRVFLPRILVYKWIEEF